MSGNDTVRLGGALIGVRTWIFAAVLLGFGGGSVVEAVPIPGIFNTGVDDFGALLPPSSVDPHYTMTISADPSYPPGPAIVVDPLPGTWLANTPSAQWINPSGLATTHFTGIYEYEMAFDMAGLDPSTGIITGAWALDDGAIVAAILINGVVVPGSGHSYPGWLALEPFSVTAGFLPGINTITFVTSNEPSISLNPTGLIVHGILSDAHLIPEPTTLTLVTLALLSLAYRRRK